MTDDEIKKLAAAINGAPSAVSTTDYGKLLGIIATALATAYIAIRPPPVVPIPPTPPPIVVPTPDPIAIKLGEISADVKDLKTRVEAVEAKVKK